MSNINIFIKDNIKSISQKNIYISPEIPEKKLNNAIKSFGCENNYESILAIYDDTLFGSAKDGMVFTGEKMIYKAAFEDKIELFYDTFKSVEYIKNITTNDKGKEKIEEYVLISIKDAGEYKIQVIQDCDYKELADILSKIHTDHDEFKEEDQLVTLSEMSEKLKVAYVKVIINMAFSDDDQVDEKEFSEILLLMTRLDLSTESRFTLRAYTAPDTEHESLEKLLSLIDSEALESHRKSIRISLVKDLLSTYMSVNDGSYENFEYLSSNQSLLDVSDEEIELAVMAIKNDFNMLRDDFSDEALTKGMKELAAKAGAVGVPLAAVYLSGSVVGMSAAGLTSGLASLGLGGMLGFSGMATGIGVAVILGVVTYKGVRNLTGANELDKVKRRELMLTDVIKQTQSTISLLITDINYITLKLNTALDNHDIQDKKIKKLMKMMAAMTGAASVLNNKSGLMENTLTKLHCPKILNINKLKTLTAEPTKKPLFDLILKYYKEQKNTTDEDNEVLEYRLRAKIPTNELDKLAMIFDKIGYFKVTDIIAGAASDLAEQAKSKLTGFFS